MFPALTDKIKSHDFHRGTYEIVKEITPFSLIPLMFEDPLDFLTYQDLNGLLCSLMIVFGLLRFIFENPNDKLVP